MAVSVIHYTNAGVEGKTTHSTAVSIAVDDGHLLVRAPGSTSNKTIAIYSPKRWVSAQVDDPS